MQAGSLFALFSSTMASGTITWVKEGNPVTTRLVEEFLKMEGMSQTVRQGFLMLKKIEEIQRNSYPSIGKRIEEVLPSWRRFMSFIEQIENPDFDKDELLDDLKNCWEHLEPLVGSTRKRDHFLDCR